MPTAITFTDAIGTATLTNGKPYPGDRFAGWETHSLPQGASAARQSDGALSMFVFRIDYGASFSLTQISSREVAGVAPIDLADRLIAWLMQGGTCSIATGDADSNVYPTCGLLSGSSASLKLSDPKLLEYTLTLEVVNLAAPPVRMVCRYENQT